MSDTARQGQAAGSHFSAGFLWWSRFGGQSHGICCIIAEVHVFSSQVYHRRSSRWSRISLFRVLMLFLQKTDETLHGLKDSRGMLKSLGIFMLFPKIKQFHQQSIQRYLLFPSGQKTEEKPQENILCSLVFFFGRFFWNSWEIQKCLLTLLSRIEYQITMYQISPSPFFPQQVIPLPICLVPYYYRPVGPKFCGHTLQLISVSF